MIARFLRLCLAMLVLACSGMFFSSCLSESSNSESEIFFSSCASESSSSEYAASAVFGAVLLRPAAGSSDTAVNESLQVRFSKKINPDSVNASTLRLYKMSSSQTEQTDATRGALVLGGIVFPADGMSAIFDPSQDLSHDALYKPFLSADSAIKSEDGEYLASAPAWHFRTKPLDSDYDGLSDYDETNDHNTDPNESDSDHDGLNDYAEITAGLDPTSADAASNTDTLYEYQWHLKNTVQTDGYSIEEDIKIEPVWKKYAGNPKIKVAVVDTGVQSTHPDLTPNLNESLSCRYSDGSHNPSPDYAQLKQKNLDYNHGTACAGLIAARGWNQLGVRGVAPFVQLVGLNVFSSMASSAFQHALGRTDVHVSSNSWGNSVWGMAYLSELDGVEQGILLGRQGKGIIYVFAAGNKDFNYNLSSNLNNSRFVINVAAVNANGQKSSYSNYGANILLAAPGGEGKEKPNDPRLVTTDYTALIYGYDRTGERFNVAGNETGDYTNRMKGTSAATPIVAGAAALILRANPALTYRDVKYILATTARKNDLSDPGWTGSEIYRFNHNYGFGILDVQEAVAKAETFSGLSVEKISPEYPKQENRAIPDNSGDGVESTIDVSESLTVEHVNVWVTITNHPRIWDLKITLKSPSDATSALAFSIEKGVVLGLPSGSSYNKWKFASVRHLDESSDGVWTLKVEDAIPEQTGNLTKWSLQIIGR